MVDTAISVGRVVEIQTAITNSSCSSEIYNLLCMYVVQSFIKGHRKSGVISIKHS